ncbi:MAG: glycosyltransferase [Prevotella sp.]|nr:glycosyltransferase [Prevotella sp.]
MEKTLTVIIPTYNMETYIERCLLSLLHPKHIDSVEILVVNDGSTDGSSAIAHRIARQYPHSIKVIDKPNGNYGSCINAALPVATGKYVKILDADDRFDTDNFGLMLEEMAQQDADLVVTHFATVDAEGQIGRTRHIHLPAGRTVSLARYAGRRSVQGLWMHEIAYRRANLLRMGYRQREGISYTDVQWGFSPMATVQTVHYIDELVYIYNVGREGQSMSAETYRKRFAQEFCCTEAMLDDYVRLHCPDRHIGAMMTAKIEGRIAALYKRALVELCDLHNQAMQQFDETLRQKAPHIYQRLDRSCLSLPLFPIRYIHLWRKDKQGWLLGHTLALYRKYKGIETSL